MIKMISEYELELRSFPYAMVDNQVIYIESEYNPRVNEFLKDNYWRIRNIFSEHLLDFIYIPGDYAHAMEEGPRTKDWLSNRLPMSRAFLEQKKPNLTTGEVFDEKIIIDPIAPSCICNGFGYSLGHNLYFDAYHLNLSESFTNDDCLLLQFEQIAEAYSHRSHKNILADDELNYNDPEIKHMLFEIERLQRALRLKGVKPEVFDKITQSLNKVSPIIVGHDAKVYLPDFDMMEIEMNPATKTLYLLILSHPEGVHPDAIVGHWDEMIRVYEGLTRYEDRSKIEAVMETLCNEEKTSLYSNISHLRKNLIKRLGTQTAANYAIVRNEDKLYHININPSMVLWQDDFWKVK